MSSTPPPSEPCVRISRTRLSSRWSYLKEDRRSSMSRFRALQPTLGSPRPMAQAAPAQQGRRQSFRSRRRFIIAPVFAGGISGWASPSGTRPGLVRRSGRHDSTFLHPFAPPALPGFVATMGALTPGRSALRRLWGRPGLSVSRVWSSEPSVSNHLTAPIVALTPNPSARWASHENGSGFRHYLADSPVSPAESSSLTYGRLVHFPLLSTPPRGDAVTFSYRPEWAYLKRTYTSLAKHAYGRTRSGCPA